MSGRDRPRARHKLRFASLALTWLAARLVLALPAGAAPRPTPVSGLAVEKVASGLESPVHLTSPPLDPRLFVVEQPGRIRIVERGVLLSEPFMDITDRVGYGGERGLLSLAFHPRYAENGAFFVNYTDRSGDTQVERYRVSADSNRADPASGRLVLRVEQPYANHNGGHILFGPDGMLYIGMGDGGSGGDPHGNGQNPATLLGKLLRIDVSQEPYAIPADNPSQRGMRREIWALGLRNPWRMAFDRETGLLYIADVGQNLWEEVHVVPGRRPGTNYGWNIMEGRHCFRRPICDQRGLTLPVLEYGHDEGCSITGGLVYRGTRIPAAIGRYFFSDYCTGFIRSFRYVNGAATELREWRLPRLRDVTSFGEDSEGEMYVLTQDGTVRRIVPAPGAASN